MPPGMNTYLGLHAYKVLFFLNSVTRQLQELVRGHHKLKYACVIKILIAVIYVCFHKKFSVHWDSSNYIMTTSGLGPTVTLPPSCQGTRILDPANPFNNVYRSGVSNSSDTKDVETEWDLIVRRIDSLDLTEPDVQVVCVPV